MRLIDADAFIEEARNRIEMQDLYLPIHIKELVIDEMPTVDAVEVIRCGECKHMTAKGKCLEFADDCLRPSASDFCSYGERREE